MKRTLYILIGLILGSASLAYAAVPPYQSSQQGSNPVNGYYLQTNGSVSSWSPVSSTGGTGFSTTSANYWLVSTSSPLQVGSILATSTTATSTFSGKLTVNYSAGGNQPFVVTSNGDNFSLIQTTGSSGSANATIGLYEPNNDWGMQAFNNDGSKSFVIFNNNPNNAHYLKMSAQTNNITFGDTDYGNYGKIGFNVGSPAYNVDIKDPTGTGYDIGNSTTGDWNITNAGAGDFSFLGSNGDIQGLGELKVGGKAEIGGYSPAYALDISDSQSTGIDVGNSTTGLWNVDDSGNGTFQSLSMGTPYRYVNSIYRSEIDHGSYGELDLAQAVNPDLATGWYTITLYNHNTNTTETMYAEAGQSAGCSPSSIGQVCLDSVGSATLYIYYKDGLNHDFTSFIQPLGHDDTITITGTTNTTFMVIPDSSGNGGETMGMKAQDNGQMMFLHTSSGGGVFATSNP